MRLRYSFLETLQLGQVFSRRILDDKVEKIAGQLFASDLESGVRGPGHVLYGESGIIDKRDEHIRVHLLEHIQLVLVRPSEPVQVFPGDCGLDAGDEPVLASDLAEVLKENASVDVVRAEIVHYRCFACIERSVLHVDDGNVASDSVQWQESGLDSAGVLLEAAFPENIFYKFKHIVFPDK